MKRPGYAGLLKERNQCIAVVLLVLNDFCSVTFHFNLMTVTNSCQCSSQFTKQIFSVPNTGKNMESYVRFLTVR